MFFPALEKFGGLRPRTTKGGHMIFPGRGLRPHKMRPNDFCRLWKNHFASLAVALLCQT